MKISAQHISLCLALLPGLAACQPQPAEAPQKKDYASVSEALSNTRQQGFERALKPRLFVFPEDDGPHPSFETEWWYYTGNLDTQPGQSGKQHFGYQLTFFRRALAPTPRGGRSAWAAHQLYFAHLALSDISQQRFLASQRLSRGALGLAGANATEVWLEDWSVKQTPQGAKLQARTPDFSLELLLKPLKPEVLQGQQGLSQKSAAAGNASYYYSRPRLATSGSLELGGKRLQLSGLSWLDREWSTSALSPNQVGWDWFSLQLSDGRDLMLYQLRRKDGSVDPVSSGSLIAADGSSQTLQATDFEIEVLQHWRSPATGIRYPGRWRLNLPQHQLSLEVTPWQADQELKLDFVYWEGAVQVKGLGHSTGLQGNGYVELTGYEASPD